MTSFEFKVTHIPQFHPVDDTRVQWSTLVISIHMCSMTTHLAFFVFFSRSYPICVIIIFQVQVFMVGRFFIQPKLDKNDKDRPLAVDNVYVYMYSLQVY